MESKAVSEPAQMTVENTEGNTDNVSNLLAALQRLDRLLEKAITSAQAVYGPQAAIDPFRGLHISQEEVEQLLTRLPGTPTLYVAEESLTDTQLETGRDIEPLSWLAKELDLSSFDLDVIVIALAPELDLRYERLYAYLQDDVSRKRPGVDLALNLLCPTMEARLMRRSHFGSQAPLIQHSLLHLLPDPHQTQPPLLSHYLKLDEQVIHLLLSQKSLDPTLSPFCQLVQPATTLNELVLNREVWHVLTTLLVQAREGRKPLRLYFHGPHGTGKRSIAEALSGLLNMPLMVMNLLAASKTRMHFEQLLGLALRTAWYQDALLYFENLEALGTDELALQHLMTVLASSKGIVILSGIQSRLPIPLASRHDGVGVISVPFPIPSFAARKFHWRTALEDAASTLDAESLDALAGRFSLTPGQITNAVITARNSALWRSFAQPRTANQTSAPPHPTLSDLFTAARGQSSQEIETLAHKIEPRYTWDDIVLPPDQLAQLREIWDQARYRHIVYDEWGFDRKMHMGKGLNILFSGPPGTGKTMAAEVITRELELDLYKIDLSQVVSKYIGETEKNLDRIFTAAASTNAILFFDEADSLFGKRSQVQDAHDRYANIEIGYLLQKMEEYDGIAILATNLRQNIDEAFLRRVKFSIEFPFPDEPYRLNIWQAHFPSEAPISDDVDFAFLARQLKLAGGSIKNIVLNASFMAAADDQCIHMKHLILAARREYQKMGRACTQAIFGEYMFLIKDL
jgi:SpoVK/Ycf46/Vps4 family AAA+-type ATPase